MEKTTDKMRRRIKAKVLYKLLEDAFFLTEEEKVLRIRAILDGIPVEWGERVENMMKIMDTVIDEIEADYTLSKKKGITANEGDILCFPKHANAAK